MLLCFLFTQMTHLYPRGTNTLTPRWLFVKARQFSENMLWTDCRRITPKTKKCLRHSCSCFFIYYWPDRTQRSWIAAESSTLPLGEVTGIRTRLTFTSHVAKIDRDVRLTKLCPNDKLLVNQSDFCFPAPGYHSASDQSKLTAAVFHLFPLSSVCTWWQRRRLSLGSPCEHAL